MAKDPAFLFYFHDFLVGTADMTNEEVGAYIKCLCFQAAKGGITEKHMKNICSSNEVHSTIKSKFIFDAAAGLWKNQRLDIEMEKRKSYSLSRANNRKKKEDVLNTSKTYVPHMVNENVNENVNEKKDKNGVDFQKTENPIFKSATDAWFDFYTNTHPGHGIPPTFDALSGKKLKSILSKLKAKHTEAGGDWTPDVADSLLRALFEAAANMRWLKDNFRLSNIDSQFDAIITNKIKINGSHTSLTSVLDAWDAE